MLIFQQIYLVGVDGTTKDTAVLVAKRALSVIEQVRTPQLRVQLYIQLLLKSSPDSCSLVSARLSGDLQTKDCREIVVRLLYNCIKNGNCDNFLYTELIWVK